MKRFSRRPRPKLVVRNADVRLNCVQMTMVTMGPVSVCHLRYISQKKLKFEGFDFSQILTHFSEFSIRLYFLLSLLIFFRHDNTLLASDTDKTLCTSENFSFSSVPLTIEVACAPDQREE